VPDARLLAIRVMHSDGTVYEGDLICALRELYLQVSSAQEAGDCDGLVDVVSLSLGYFSEDVRPNQSSGIRDAIDLLRGLGVLVIAAAGNFSTSRRFYPAAFARRDYPAGVVPLISVGALNPNGTKALFSDGGSWITAWGEGAMVVSTYPTDINASRGPEVRMRADRAEELPPGARLPADREALDPDDYRGGFALWSGTSFAAPLVAAHVTSALLAPADNPEVGLMVPGAEAAAGRVLAALTELGWPG
jgi:subtilisin family serine protease